MKHIRPLICIVGPTASGKSSVAEQVAVLADADIISIDAMQVYTGMDIGTAKTPSAERLRPLHMVDVCPVDENYSVERFQADARACIDALIDRGDPPILCGGTGLYLNAVIDEMVFPSGYRGDERRERYERLAREEGSEALYELLRRRDPDSAGSIHTNNTRRVIRALELCDEGKSYAESLKTLHVRAPHYRSIIFGLDMPREMLYRRIDARVDAMFDAGLVEEVAHLVSCGLTRDTTAGQAIGYKEVLEALAGALTFDEAREAIKTSTRRYAKRQLSWFRHDARVRWIDMASLGARDAAQHIWEEACNASL